MNLEDHIGKQIESHSLTPVGGVVLTKLGGLYTVSPKLVEPDRDKGAVHLETTRARRNSLDTTTGGFEAAGSQSEQAGSTGYCPSRPWPHPLPENCADRRPACE